MSRQEGHELLAGAPVVLRLVTGVLPGESIYVEDDEGHVGFVYAAPNAPVVAVIGDEHGMDINHSLFRKAA